VLGQIVVCPVCDTPEFAPAEWEEELDIRCGLAVKAQLLLLMIPGAHLVFLDAERFQPVNAVFFPVSEPLEISIRLTEEFQLHLLKLSRTEGKVTRCNLITEGLAHLRDSERYFLSGGSLDIFKVYKDTLSCLRP